MLVVCQPAQGKPACSFSPDGADVYGADDVHAAPQAASRPLVHGKESRRLTRLRLIDPSESTHARRTAAEEEASVALASSKAQRRMDALLISNDTKKEKLESLRLWFSLRSELPWLAEAAAALGMDRTPVPGLDFGGGSRGDGGTGLAPTQQMLDAADASKLAFEESLVNAEDSAARLAAHYASTLTFVNAQLDRRVATGDGT